MKPKSKEQKRVSAIILKPLTEKDEKVTETKCFLHLAYYNGKTAHCSECGNAWQLGDYKRKTTICPSCGKRLTVRQTHKRNFEDIQYFCVTQRHQEYQVFRYFLIIKRMKKGTATQYETHEVCRKFYNTNNEKITIFAKPYVQYAYRAAIPFYVYGDFSIQKEKFGYYYKYIFCIAANIVKSIHPALKKRGFCGNLYGNGINLFFTKLKITAFETLYKQRQFSAFADMAIDEIQRYFPIIKVANRHGYKIKDFSLWKDLVNALNYCGKDTHNPKFICPKDLKKEHDFWCRKKKVLVDKENKRREKEREERLFQKALQDEKNYIEKKQRFFDIAIKSKNLTIVPLKSIQEFKDEGTAMHHCVFSCGYYKLDNILILSAKDGENKRLATIELALNNFSIRQCRAVCNAIPERDNEIRNLIQKNMFLFQKAMA